MPSVELSTSTPALLVAAGLAALLLRFSGPVSRAHLALFRAAGNSPRGLGLGLRFLWLAAAAGVLAVAALALLGRI